MEVAFEAKDAFDWADLVKELTVEDVKIGENGYYDSQRYPGFHDWIIKSMNIHKQSYIEMYGLTKKWIFSRQPIGKLTGIISSD